jgi:hypothetical protein
VISFVEILHGFFDLHRAGKWATSIHTLYGYGEDDSANKQAHPASSSALSSVKFYTEEGLMKGLVVTVMVGR